MIRTLIVEDEAPAMELLKIFLSKHSEIEIIGEATDGFSAIKSINEHKPDLLFMDIQLPKLNGFEILELLDYMPVVIFTTAYDQFAIKAFEINATDYLLKPFSIERFDQALQRAFQKVNTIYTQKSNSNYNNLLTTIDEKIEIIERVVVKTGTKIKVIPVERIIYFEAQDDYVMIYTEDGKHLKEKTMKYFETHLDNSKFVRIHRSYIVNVNHILQLEHFNKESYVAKLKNGVSLRISNNGYKTLKDRLNF
jgi:two-component system LytT family response regulator